MLLNSRPTTERHVRHEGIAFHLYQACIWNWVFWILFHRYRIGSFVRHLSRGRDRSRASSCRSGGCEDIGCSLVDLGDHPRCCGGGRISGRCAPRGNVLCSGFSFQKDRLFDFIPLTLLVLDWSGVASNAPQQSVSAVWAIRILIGPASSVLLLAGIAFAIYYPLSRESHAETREKITAHRKAPAD